MSDWLDYIELKSSNYMDMMRTHNYGVLRNLKIDITLGNIELKPEKLRLSKDLWDKCVSLSKKGFIIGGSVSCKLYGLLTRNTDDIDIFKSSVTFHKDVKVYRSIYEADEKFNRGKIDTKIGVLDVFEMDTPYEIYEGIKWGDPLISFKAKAGYNRHKDYYDFREMDDLYKKMLHKEKYLFI